MFTWVIQKHLARLHVANAHDLAKRARLSYPVASRIWINEPFARADASTLKPLADFLGVKRAKATTLFALLPD